MTKPTILPSAEMLRALLSYEQDTGLLFWKKRDVSMFKDGAQSAQWRCDRWNSRFEGKRAFTAKKSDNYYHSSIGGKWMSAHRVIWKMVKGEDPDIIDHIDGNRENNRISNLRSVSMALNLKNSARRPSLTNPYTGVSKMGKRWQAYVHLSGKKISLGCHDTPEAAWEARKNAELSYGYHPNHGRSAVVSKEA